MSDLLNEVINDQNDETKLKFVKNLIVVSIIITLLSVIILITWKLYNNKQIIYRQGSCDILLQNILENNLDESLKLKSLEAVLNQNQKVKVNELIAIRLAIQQLHNNKDKAKELLTSVSSDPKAHELSAAYARLIWLCLSIDSSDISSDDKKIMSDCFSYFADKQKPFYGTATILKIIWYIRSNQKELASPLLQNIISSYDLPNIIKEQAIALLSDIERKK